MKHNFLYFILILFLVGCSTKDPQNSNIPEERNLFEKYSFIHDYTELDDSCRIVLSKMLDNIFIHSPTDTIVSIFYLDADLFPGHYSQAESDKFEKYMVRVEKLDTTENKFIVIKKDPCYLQVGFYIPKFDILTIDCNMMYVNRFSFLNNCNAGDIRELYLEIDSAGAMFSNITYSVSMDSLFVVDSIYSSKHQECLFSELDTFEVSDNNQMIFKNSSDKIDFEYDKYSLLFTSGKKSIQHWVVSDSKSHRILFDENKNYIFLSRIRKRTFE